MNNISLDNIWVKRIFSVFLALGLFFFVNYEDQMRFQSNEPNDGASVRGTEILTNLPIEVNIDTEQFFVSGIPDSATLRIDGPQAVIFQTVYTKLYNCDT